MANKEYVARETPVEFSDATTESITLANLLTDAARVSDRYDQSTGSTPGWWEWRATFQMDTAGVVGETVDLYIAFSDGTLEDGDVGAVDAAVLTPVLPNLTFMGSASIQVTTLSTDFRTSGRIFIPTRYFSVVVHNNTADSLENTSGVNTITMTPIPPEIQ